MEALRCSQASPPERDCVLPRRFAPRLTQRNWNFSSHDTSDDLLTVVRISSRLRVCGLAGRACLRKTWWMKARAVASVSLGLWCLAVTRPPRTEAPRISRYSLRAGLQKHCICVLNREIKGLSQMYGQCSKLVIAPLELPVRLYFCFFSSSENKYNSWLLILHDMNRFTGCTKKKLKNTTNIFYLFVLTSLWSITSVLGSSLCRKIWI